MPTPSAAAAQSPAPAATGMPSTRPEISGDSSAGGSQASGMSSAASTSSDQRRRGDVEEQRPRRIGDVGRPLTGEPKPHVVLGQADRGAIRVEDRRLVAAQPEQLRRREPRERAVSRQLDQAIDADQVFDLGALFARALVVPENRGTEHASAPRRAPRARASARRARSRRRRRPRETSASAASAARHQSSGSCSDQPGCGVESGYGRSARATHRSVGRDRDRLHAGRAHVEPDADGHAYAPSAA